MDVPFSPLGEDEAQAATDYLEQFDLESTPAECKLAK
jgi:hypothetical protein